MESCVFNRETESFAKFTQTSWELERKRRGVQPAALISVSANSSRRRHWCGLTAAYAKQEQETAPLQPAVSARPTWGSLVWGSPVQGARRLRGSPSVGRGSPSVGRGSPSVRRGSRRSATVRCRRMKFAESVFPGVLNLLNAVVARPALRLQPHGVH